MTQPQPKPLSESTYDVALRMHHEDNRLPKPQLEDYLHLDRTPPPPPRLAPRPPVDQQAVSACLRRMQAADPNVKFAEPDGHASAPGTPVGATPGSTAPLDDRVKATLARMQSGSGVKFAEPPGPAA
jgi:hypothetical protein